MSYLDTLLQTDDGKRILNQERTVLSVAQRVIEIMEEKQITQKQLSQKLGVKAPRVSKILRGDANITLRTLADICLALESDLKVLIGDEDRKLIEKMADDVRDTIRRVEILEAKERLKNFQSLVFDQYSSSRASDAPLREKRIESAIE